MRHRIGGHVVFTDPFLDFRRQVRRGTARQRPRQVIARQRRQRPRYRLRRLLQVAAGAIFLHRLPISVGLLQRRLVALKLRVCRQGRFQPGDISLRTDHVHRLAANLPNQLRLLEPLLLLLLVEYRADAAGVGVIRITV